MNILITGSSGFISSYLVPKLRELGHKVVGMDIKNDEWDDVRDYAACLAKLKDIDCVVHLAAFTDVQESIALPLTYFQDDEVGLFHMLYASINKGVKRFIFASSAAADSPQSPYGASKLCGETWCDIFQKCYGLSTISLRFFNVYGIGTEKGVIPTWIKAIKNGERPVIYGGNQVRDFIYVKDVVRSILHAMECDATGVYEIGTGRGIAIFDLAQEILSAMQSDLKIIPKERKEGEIQESIARHMGHTLNWIGFKPRYMLKQGLGEMLK